MDKGDEESCDSDSDDIPDQSHGKVMAMCPGNVQQGCYN